MPSSFKILILNVFVILHVIYYVDGRPNFFLNILDMLPRKGQFYFLEYDI